MHKGTGTLCTEPIKVSRGVSQVSWSHGLMRKNPVLYFVYLFNFYINIYIKQ